MIGFLGHNEFVRLFYFPLASVASFLGLRRIHVLRMDLPSWPTFVIFPSYASGRGVPGFRQIVGVRVSRNLAQDVVKAEFCFRRTEEALRGPHGFLFSCAYKLGGHSVTSNGRA